MSGRDQILTNLAAALGDRPPEVPIPRDYHPAGIPSLPDVTELFEERVRDYEAVVRRCTSSELTSVIAASLTARGARRIVTPSGLPAEVALAALGIAMGDDPPLTVDELDAADGVLTTCRLAIATTGTIVLDHAEGQGRRALTLLPDYHLAVVFAGQIVAAVPDAIAALDPRRPMTWISGPSATSDIELSRVEGVHGPRQLEVLVVAG